MSGRRAAGAGQASASSGGPHGPAGEAWYRLYVEVDCRDGTVWEIQRLAGGGAYRILRGFAEPGTRRSRWDSVRAQFCRLAWPMCPDLDEPRAEQRTHSFVVSHGPESCEVGRAVASSEGEALSCAAAVFEMRRKRRADDAFRRLLGL